jgi:hypothetical protein
LGFAHELVAPAKRAVLRQMALKFDANFGIPAFPEGVVQMPHRESCAMRRRNNIPYLRVYLRRTSAVISTRDPSVVISTQIRRNPLISDRSDAGDWLSTEEALSWCGYSDDFIVGFQHRSDAEPFLRELRDRLTKFRLELHPDKRRLIAFRRFDILDGQRRDEAGTPQTFQLSRPHPHL